MLSSFVAQGAFLKVSAKQWILNSVRQLMFLVTCLLVRVSSISVSCGLAGVFQVSETVVCTGV